VRDAIGQSGEASSLVSSAPEKSEIGGYPSNRAFTLASNSSHLSLLKRPTKYYVTNQLVLRWYEIWRHSGQKAVSLLTSPLLIEIWKRQNERLQPQ